MALQEKCDQSLKAVTHQTEQKSIKLVQDTEKKLEQLQNQLKDEFKKFADTESQQRQQAIESLDKKLGAQLGQVQQEVKAASASTATLATAMEDANAKVNKQFSTIVAAKAGCSN